MFKKSVLIVFVLTLLTSHYFLLGQNGESYETLDAKFRNYEVFETNASQIYQQIASLRSGGFVELKITEDITWKLHLENSEILSDNYLVVEATENGVIKRRGTQILPMQGYIDGQPNSRVSLTFNDNFIYGFIKSGFSTYFIEPLYHHEKGVPDNTFVFYSEQDVIQDDSRKCGLEIYQEELTKSRKSSPERSGQRMPGGCLRVDYALASDWTMVDHYGNQGAQNHNVGVMNNVQTNYDDEFADEIQFVIVEQWLSTCSTCDPWPTTTNSSTVLNSFTSWALSGFSAAHNLGSMWSRRNYNNNVIGLAWVGVLCTSNRYNILSDFSNNAQQKRVLMAHEIGHNFDASHNSGIMAPSVNTSNQWTATSVNEIEAHYNQAWCLDDCPGSNPVTVDFDYVQTEICDVGEVAYEGISNNASTWNWTFENGTPSTSTEQFPVVTYDVPGTYQVTLEASNGSSTDVETKFVTVDVVPFPVSDFQYIVNGLQVNFVYTGLGAVEYDWDFGDGNISSAQNPLHVYSANGIYNVTLEISNACGFNSITVQVEINAPPFVNFTSSTQDGCQPFDVGYTSLATNVDSIRWSFPGGTPSFSVADNPVVTYNQPGFYQVTLEGFNSSGTNVIVRDSFIRVQPLAATGFSWTLMENVIEVSNSGIDFDSIYWSFGDGNTSSDENPVHSYGDNGQYIITQHLVNGCGLSTLTDTVNIALPPVSQWEYDNNSVCVNEPVQFFENILFSADSLRWTFIGGNPTTSNESQPIVQYGSPGYYGITLVSWNAYGTDTLHMDSVIHVVDIPSVNFSYLTDTLVVQFSSVISDEDSFEWNFGDGNTSSDADPLHTYSAYGNYLVTLTAENICGTRSVQQEVIVQPIPTASFTTDDNPVCAGRQVQFTNNSSSSATSYEWTFEGGIPATSTDREPMVTYNTPGTYSVSLTVTNNSGSGQSVIDDYIIVESAPVSSFSFTTDTLVFNGEFTGTTGTTVQWLFGDGTTSNDTNPQHVYQDFGSYEVTLISSNSCGNDTLEQTVHMYIRPEAELSSSASWVCGGDSVQFFNMSGGPYTAISWIFEGGQPSTSNEENPVIYYPNGGVYDVQLTVTNPLGSDVLLLEDYIEIEGLPVADFSSNIRGLDFSATFSGAFADNVSWDFGDGSTSGEFNPVHMYSSEGTYIVTLIVSNSCGEDTLSREFTITTSSTDQILQNEIFSVFPNPAGQFINIVYKNPIGENAKILISNALGQTIEQFDLIPNMDNGTVKNLMSYSSGVYFITLTNEGESISRPFIIIR